MSLREQLQNLPILATVENTQGRVYIVTGSNIGLGLETARHLVRLQASKVILAVRNTKAGEEAKAEIETSTGRKGVAEVWHLDLASYKSVQAFAERATNELERLDVLAENAAVALDQWSRSEGMETSTTINVIGTILLGVLLLPKLADTGRRFGSQPHLAVVVSGLGFFRQKELDKIKNGVFEGLNKEEVANMDARYALTKLVEMYALRELAQLVPVSRTGVVITQVHPGLCNTGLVRHTRLFTRLQIHVVRSLIGRTAEMGSRTILHGIVAENDSHGKYLSGCAVKESSWPEWMTNSDGKKMQKQIWDELVKILEGIKPGCISAIL